MKVKLIVSAIIALCLVSGIGVYAEEQKSRGKGNVEGMVQFGEQDILYLEREIENLVSECGKEQ